MHSNNSQIDIHPFSCFSKSHIVDPILVQNVKFTKKMSGCNDDEAESEKRVSVNQQKVPIMILGTKWSLILTPILLVLDEDIYSSIHSIL